MRRSRRSCDERQRSIQRACESEAMSMLWITGSSPGLVEALTKIKRLGQVTLLRHGQDDRDDSPLSEGTLDLIATAIIRRGVRHVVVCGQEEPTEHRRTPCNGSTAEAASGYQSLVQRLTVRIERQRRAQAQVCRWIRQIRSHPLTSQSISAYSVPVCGLFFVATSNQFLMYSPEKDRFLPILEEG